MSGSALNDPKLEYDRGSEGIAVGTLTTSGGDCVRMWTMEAGSGRELLFLAFKNEFMPDPKEKFDAPDAQDLP